MAKLFIFVTLCLLPLPVFALTTTKFFIQNNCTFPIYSALSTQVGRQLSPTGFKLKSGAFRPIHAPENWTGSIWARYHCSIKPTGVFSCDSGDCVIGKLNCEDSTATPPVTLVEFSIKGRSNTNYGISTFNGFNLPVTVIPESPLCETATCAGNINSLCPSTLQHVVPDGAVVGCHNRCFVMDDADHASIDERRKCEFSVDNQFFQRTCSEASNSTYNSFPNYFTCQSSEYRIIFCPAPVELKFPVFYEYPSFGILMTVSWLYVGILLILKTFLLAVFSACIVKGFKMSWAKFWPRPEDQGSSASVSLSLEIPEFA